MSGMSADRKGAPLAERMRPAALEEMVGQGHLLGSDRPLARALESGRMSSVILWGPPGSGKTTLARLMERYSRLPFRSFSAVTSGVKDLREVVEAAQKEKERSGRATLLFVDEIHRLNKAQQDAFLPHLENGLIVLVGATTENPSFEVIAPLLSRARVMTLKPLSDQDIRRLLERALADKEKGLGEMGLRLTPEALDFLVSLSQGDARVALNDLEAAADYHLAGPEPEKPLETGELEQALSRKALAYDKAGEEHYNLISAFHKSLRGGDAQAAVYWLYRMLEAGEDALFIARRMIRFASEDVGLADPQALPAALAAFEAWEKVGPPEARLALMQAAVYLAAAPKSNALYMAEKRVRAAIEQHGALSVPLHIRNAPTRLMKELGYGKGYLYPHDHPGALVAQTYLPDKLMEAVFYTPAQRGFEREIDRRLASFKRLLKKKEEA